MKVKSIALFLLCLLLVASGIEVWAQTYPQSFRKISKTQGHLNAPVDEDAAFGIMSSAIGDIDDDGVTDLAVGATNEDGTYVGAAYVLLMNYDGTVKSSTVISSLSHGEQYAFGSSISSVGDLDDDGVEDIAVGAAYDDDKGYRHGALWIIFLYKNGSAKSWQRIGEGSGGFNGSLTDMAEFGSGSSSIGDLDGDGNTELVVGARYSGYIYILYLNNNGTVKKFKTISSADGLEIDMNDGLVGYQVAGIGDLDKDGVPDIAIGGHRSDVNGIIDSGVVFIVFLNSSGSVKGHTRIAPGLGGFNDPGTRLFGVGLVGIGDYDGDGTRDIAVGADDSGKDTGALWYLMLNTNGTVKSSYKISSLSNNSNLTLHDGDFFGGSISYLGDINQDGIPDLAVGAFSDNDGASNAGAVWITIPSCNAKSVAGSDRTTCPLQPLTMNATLNPGSSGMWSVVKGNATFDNSSSPNAIVGGLHSGENLLTWTIKQYGCIAIDTVKVTVIDLAAHISMPDTTYTCDKKITINADTSKGAGRWSIINGEGEITDPTKNETVFIFGNDNKPVEVVWTISFDGCSDVKDSTVLVALDFNINDVPNVITPNNDGHNDHWELPVLNNLTNQVRLYNRWGKEVFKSTDYKNDWSGNNVAPGIYFYFVTVSGCRKEFKGWLSIVN